MSEEGSSQSPEPSTPAEQQAPLPPVPAAPAPGARPKWLSAIAITAMVLGGLFGCCGVTSLGGQVMNRAMNPMMQKMMTGDAQNPAARDFMDRNAAVQVRIFPYALTAGLLGLLHSIALLVAGIMAQNGRASGRTLLALVCMVGIGVELVSGGISIYVSRETSAATAQMMNASFALQPGAQPGQQTPEQKQAHEMGQKFASGAARAGSILGIVMIVFFFAIKTGYYVVTMLYLRRRDVVEFFEAPRSTAAA